jgi:hypothetical protein
MPTNTMTFDELVNDGQIDWEDLLDRVGDGPSWSPLDPGDYLVEVTEVVPTYNSLRHGQWVLKMRVAEGDDRGHPIWAMVTLDGYDKNKTAVFFRVSNCLGIPLTFYADHPSTEEVAQEMTGRHVIVTVNEHVVDGLTTIRVVGYRPATS